MKPLIIHGQLEQPTLVMTDVPSSFSHMVIPKLSAKLQRARSGHSSHTIRNLNPDDLVKLELEDGIILWVRAEYLESDLGLSSSRSAETQTLEMPYSLPLSSSSRGLIGEWVLKGLKVFEVNLVDTTMNVIKNKVEGILQPGPGLYQWQGQDGDRYQPVKQGALPTGSGHEPWLVFIHGTASSSDGSFGGLWEEDGQAKMTVLQEKFANRVLAFQHRTLSQDPIHNALDLVNWLPKGAHLHLVSHSRGGLVGELLCRGMNEERLPFSEQDFAIFSRLGRKEDHERLRELDSKLREKNLNIERFVRVGCPARGTTLAGRRLDRYLSIIFNALRLVPGLQANPIYEGITTFIAAVVKNRTDPKELPGLEAQMPESPLIQILNRQGVRTRADLHVLGGDVAGSGIVGRLKAFVTDLFYREDHDLVVNTPAMFGGAERVDGVRYWVDTGKNVDHFSYFRNPDTANRLVQVLTKDKDAATGFHQLKEIPSEVDEEDYRKRAIQTSQPLVVVLPGTMGTHLHIKGKRVWLDTLDLAAGGLEKLRYDATGVEAKKPIGSGYKNLIRFLAHTHIVRLFTYDWRKSLIDLAEEFRGELENAVGAQEEIGQPVRILAHSMGGLIVRVMLATTEGKKVWTRMCQHPGARFIMLGTPNGGSHAITAMLMGRDPLIRKLALLDSFHSQAELLRIISRFDGLLQLLPHDGKPDTFDVNTWEDFLIQDRERIESQMGAEQTIQEESGKKVTTSKIADVDWSLPDTAQLAEARKVKNLLQHSPIDSQRMFYVAGQAQATPCNVFIDPEAPKDRRIRIEATSCGDGRVPWSTGIPEPLKQKTYYANCEHGDLANSPAIFDALSDLLNAGTTTKLSQTAPHSRRASNTRFDYRERALDIYPGRSDLEVAALGSSGVDQAQQEPVSKVAVSVVHGNLSRAMSPVAVGHYTGDTIVSAEAYLDKQVDGRLRERQRLGLYPDVLNSSAVVLKHSKDDREHGHPGAIVVGLGQVGTLTPGGLTGTVTHAVVTYALQCLDVERVRHGGADDTVRGTHHVSLPLTTLLIGTGAGGMGVADSMQAILRGVNRANNRLQRLQAAKIKGHDSPSDEKRVVFTVAVEKVELLELYEDRAIQAMKALLDLGRSQEFRETLTIRETLVEGVEGRIRAYFTEEDGWWQRLRIQTQEDGSLKFEAPTNRARAVTYLQPTQQKLVDRFLTRAIDSTRNDIELSSSLFELIIPNEMKNYAPDHQNMVLEVDEQSAGYPWELLNDRLDLHAKPLSVAAGMVRQMVTGPTQFRENVLQGTELNALVIGDPTSKDPSRVFSPLPGAAAEAREVGRLLRQQEYHKVVELVEEDATPDAILTALYQYPYRIVHCAAHGVFEEPLDRVDPERFKVKAIRPREQSQTVTGMALGDGLFLTPVEIRQMRYVPELVFLNCCHLGHVQINGQAQVTPFHRVAANLGTQLIQMGVRVVVAAGWAVDDEAAKIFARVFYEELFGGSAFGNAVRKAREEIYRRHGDTNTWGAYQCYGDPDFSFYTGSKRSSRGMRFVAPAELRVELANLTQAVKAAPSDKDHGWFRKRLRELTEAVGESWLTSATLCAALGEAHLELQQFPEAVRYLEQSRTLEPATAPVESLEKLANAKVRWASERLGMITNESEFTDQSQPARTKKDQRVWKQEQAKEKQSIQALVDDATKILDGLLGIHESQERWSLRGRVAKGVAMVSEDAKERQKALEMMRDCYKKGYELGKVAALSNVYYPLQNWVIADIVRSWEGSPSVSGRRKANTGMRESERHGPTVEDRLSELRGYAEQAVQSGKTFWDMVLKPELQLLEALYQRELSPVVLTTIVRRFQEAQKRGESPKNRDSVIKNIQFFETMLWHSALPKKVQKDLLAGLEELRDRLVPRDQVKGKSSRLKMFVTTNPPVGSASAG